MIDVVAYLVVAAALAALLLAAWRLVRGAGRRRALALRVACAAVVSLVVVGALAYEVMNARAFQLAGHLVSRVETTERVVALTFDDGPSAAYVDDVLGALARRDARGTFYVIGAQCADNRVALADLVAGGHEIGNHTYTHPRLVGVSQGKVAHEIEATDRLIRDAGHDGPITFRPPFCKRLAAAPYYLWRHGRTTVTWDLEPDSAASLNDDPEAMAGYVADHARPGSIILLHVWGAQNGAARAALPLILERLTARGYRFVTVSELLDLAQ